MTRGSSWLEDFIEPGAPAEDRGFAADDLALGPLIGRHQVRSDIAAADVFGQRAGDIARDAGRKSCIDQSGRIPPWPAAPMHINIGIDSTKLVRDTSIAVRRAVAFSASVAGVIPNTFF